MAIQHLWGNANKTWRGELGGLICQIILGWMRITLSFSTLRMVCSFAHPCKVLWKLVTRHHFQLLQSESWAVVRLFMDVDQCVPTGDHTSQSPWVPCQCNGTGQERKIQILSRSHNTALYPVKDIWGNLKYGISSQFLWAIWSQLYNCSATLVCSISNKLDPF